MYTTAKDVDGVNDMTEQYKNMGGVYFPVLQQDGSRVLVKVANGNDITSLMYLDYLRKKDR